jgi:hypothetical protein
LLEDPNFFQEIQEKSMAQLVLHPECPHEYLVLALSHPSSIVHGFIASNPRTPPDILKEMHARGLSHNVLAKNPSSPASVLIALAECDYPSTRSLVARNPSLPRERLLLLQHVSGSLSLDVASARINGAPPASLALLSTGGVYA